jgi:hypothetical protein
VKTDARCCADLRLRLPQPLSASTDKFNVRALGGQFACDSLPDAAAGAGDDRRLA